jgi:hypothetical protein
MVKTLKLPYRQDAKTPRTPSKIGGMNRRDGEDAEKIEGVL